jgi:hypothetical protein
VCQASLTYVAVLVMSHATRHNSLCDCWGPTEPALSMQNRRHRQGVGAIIVVCRSMPEVDVEAVQVRSVL